jgi:uncharacterized membrane protein
MKNALSDQIAKNPTQFNIAAIAKLEEEALDRRTRTERDSDAIVKFIGSVKFLVLHVILVLVWVTLNLNLLPSVKPFDPICVLISQNRMARQAERRSHLDLQVGMLAEQELTMMLQMLQKLCQHSGVDVRSATRQVQGFSETTDVHKLATELEEKLPEQ